MVIQRIQSIYLLIAAVAMGIFTFCPLGQITTAEYTMLFNSWGMFSEGEATSAVATFELPTIYLTLISAIAFLLPLVDIFLYKNMPLQKRVCAIALLLTVGAASVAGILGYTAIEGSSVAWSSVVCAPIVAIIFLLLAWRGISSDQRKLRSYDRIR